MLTILDELQLVMYESGYLDCHWDFFESASVGWGFVGLEPIVCFGRTFLSLAVRFNVVEYVKVRAEGRCLARRLLLRAKIRSYQDLELAEHKKRVVSHWRHLMGSIGTRSAPLVGRSGS